jgi:diguanylate cyclase (GGDEF)-like protein
MRILLVEDDESIVELLTTVLVGQSYVVDVATDGEAGWELVEAFPYDLILLDIMLPRLDGISFCRRLRSRNNPVLVMMLTVRDTTTDKLLGLDSGADDYVVKPFNSQELIARVRALLRRGNTAVSSVLECGRLQLDPNTRNVTYAGTSLQFSRKEYLLLELFLRNPHRVFSRRAIVEHLWAFDEEAPIEDTVKSHIKNIRKELRSVGAADLIETLYGQGYRINPSYLSEANSVEPTTAQLETLDATVVQIWERKKGAFLDRLTVLEQAVQAVKSQSLDAELNQKAIENAHKLAGGLGTFGLEEGSRVARQIEELLESRFAEPLGITPQRQKRIAKPLEQLVVELRQTVQDQQNRRLTTVEAQPSATLVARPQPVVLVVHGDVGFTNDLGVEAISWNMQVVTATDVDAARTHLQQVSANLILLDLALLQNPASRSPLLAALRQYAPTTPIVVLSEQDQTSDRLSAVQLGAALFLPKSTPLPQIFQALMQLLQELNWGGVKILVVDHELQTSRLLKTSALAQSLQFTELNDPEQFWETLKSVHPDLLMLNIHLPKVNGLQLCESVRQDLHWNWLPIVALTEDATSSTIHQVLAAGADDYITKPIVPDIVSIQITNRIRRSRLLRSQAQVDALTDLSNRQQSIQGLNQLLRIAQRSQQPVCFAVLDLDHFKQVNDEYGHMQGDRVLRQFGQFLKQKFRAGDVVARWGGEEFVIGMYGITRSDGIERLAEILEEWRSMPSSSPHDTEPNVSFSAGVAQYPSDGITVQMLYRSADAALYRAKVAGRNRVLSTQWQPLSASSEADVVLIYPENDFAHALLHALDTRGYHTCWFKHGKEAIKRIRAKRSTLNAPVILLSDSLPDLSWRDFVKRLGTKHRNRTQIILLLNQADTVEKAQTDLLFDYLLAPCNTSIVMQRLRQALGSLGLY